MLDGGEKEVFLGGSRLNKFMETVESATKSIPEAMAQDAAETPEPAAHPTEPEASDTASRRCVAPGAEAPADPWSGLLQAGMALLQQFAGRRDGRRSVASLVQRDERTGESFLKIPAPKPEVLDQALQAVQALLQGLRK